MQNDSATPELLIQKLKWWTQRQPEKPLFTYFDGKGNETGSLTYQDVEEQSRNLATRLLYNGKHGYGMKKGDRALLVFLPSLEFIVAFLGCLRAGVIAVPVYPPVNVKKSLQSFASIADTSDAKVALTHSAFASLQRLQRVKSFFSRSSVKWPSVKWVAVDKYLKKPPSLNEAERAQVAQQLDGGMMEDVAFLQFTSGSTSEPKGVIISHGNLAWNLTTIISALKAEDDTVVVSWLPQYHDMGLIGSYLGTLYCGGSGWYTSPMNFVLNPPMYIEAISKYRATHIQGPNFMYLLSARKFSAKGQKPSLDLSRLRHIFNAAEPVTAASIDYFLQTFKPFNLKPTAMCPGYGLAESTVYVCDGGGRRLLVDKTMLLEKNQVVVIEEQDVEGKPLATGTNPPSEPLSLATVETLISCGVPKLQPRVDVRIVGVEQKENEETKDDAEEEGKKVEFPEDRVGEIWIQSPSIAQGYWGRRDLTEAAFNGTFTAHDGSQKSGFLCTGDLGFFHKGHLYVCGRIKDLIILRGRNLYPQDLEQTVERVEGVRGGCVAVFAVPPHQNLPCVDQDSKASEDECVVVAAEVRPETSKEHLPAIAEGIRSGISRDHTVPIASILLLKKHTVVKTTSGKISRAFNRKAYLTRYGVLQGKDRWSDAVLFEKHFATAEPEGVLDMGSSEEGIEKAPGVEAGPPPRTTGAAEGKTAERDFDDSKASLTGEALQEALLRDLAVMLEMQPSQIDPKSSLQEQGMHSMALSQFAGRLRNRYKLNITNEQGLDPELSVKWIVDNSQKLRAQPPVEDEACEAPNGATGSGGGAGAGAGAGSVGGASGDDTATHQQRRVQGAASPDTDDLQPVQRITKCQRYCPCIAFACQKKPKSKSSRK